MSKIDKDKPLPDHTKLKYEECVAKVFLEYFFDARYGCLTIIDKPDLYSEKNDIGIEVTEAVSARKKEAEKMWYTMSYVDDESKRNHIKRMEELGVPFVSEGVQSWPGQIYDDGVNSQPYDILYSALKGKLEKIKTGKYRKCGKYEVFIEGEMMPCRDWINQLTLRIIKVSDEVGFRPSRVYFLSRDVLQLFDFEEQKSTWLNARTVYCELVCKARELVEEAEENE